MKAAATVVALFCFALPAAGQSTGASLGGFVADASGARLPDATVTITNTANGRHVTLVSGEEGQFSAVALQPGAYRVAVEHHGFARWQREIVLTVGAHENLEARLAIAGVSETVEIAAGTSPRTGGARPSSVISASDLTSLPDLGRNFLVLAQLIPGAGPLNASVNRFATTRFGGAADQRSGFTTMVDGGDVDDAQWGSPTINLTKESVQEFRVFRHQFDAEYGNALSAVVSVVTRSGTNQVHGSGLYFGRDERLNARNAFAASKPPFGEQRFAASAGGPLVRDAMHLFVTYEHDRVNTARIIALPASNPFASRENGIFPATAAERMAVARFDQRISDRHGAMLRYANDDATSIRNNLTPSSDSSQVDTFSRAHSLVGEIDSMLSPRVVNALRVHWFSHESGGTPHTMDAAPGIQRPSVTTGQTVGGDWQVLSRTRVTLHDAVYISRARHDLKFGGEASLGSHELDAHFFQNGFFIFRRDEPFDANVPSTWPTSFQQQQPNVQTYDSHQFAAFVQDDWHVSSTLSFALGLRYDIEPTLRINDFYRERLASAALAGLNDFVTSDRGTDTNNIQPRLGATYELTDTLLLRAGWGIYVARNRPWFQLRSMNQLAAPAVLVEDAARLRAYPDIAAILAGTAPLQLGTVIPDDFVQAYAINSTAGIHWNLPRDASFEIDYVHSSAAHQTGFTDRNLPASGGITAANPRPSPRFAQVSMIENFTRSWYDALETQLQIKLPRAGRLRTSYTLSRSYLDGVDFFNTARGTQRTPRERGYSPSDQRHNLAAAASLPLPAGVEVSAVLKLISGSPMAVQAGLDLDGDRSQTGDRPEGLAITVGRSQVTEALRIMDAFRAALTPQPLPPVDPSLLRLDPCRTLDLRITKGFSVHGRTRIELMLEGFNVTNAVSYLPASVVHNMNSAAFLERRNARDARQVQWGVRIAF